MHASSPNLDHRPILRPCEHVHVRVRKLLTPHGRGDDGAQLPVGRAPAHRIPQAHLARAEQANLEAAVREQPQPVALRAEVLRHARHE